MKICSDCRRCFDDAVVACVEEGHAQLSEVRGGHPRIVPGYELETLVGAWTGGNAYHSRRLDCGQHCYIQIVSTDARGGESFLRDAEIAATLFDAGFVYVYESGALEGGEFYVVTEDPRATTLREHLDTNGTPNLLTSIRIVEKIAGVLHTIHLKGLTHGAVRPENILITFDTENHPAVRIGNIDFGGAVARNTLCNKFLIDNALGIIRYFAPEQCSGEPTTPRTDIYSLGVVFHELLTGAPPFDGPKAVALMGMHMNQRPPEVAVDDFELRMLVTHSLSEALQKRPSFRQSSADLIARQMRHMEQLATHVSTPPPAAEVSVAQSNAKTSRRPAEAITYPTEPIASATVRLPAGPPPAAPHLSADREATLTVGDAGAPIDSTPADSVAGSASDLVPRGELKATPLPWPVAALVPEASRDLHMRVSDVGVPPVRSVLPERRQHLRTLKRGPNPQWRAQPAEDHGDRPGPEPTVGFPASQRIAGPSPSASHADERNIAGHVPPPATPRLIRSKQPEDDIPSLEDVRAVLGEGETSSFTKDAASDHASPDSSFARAIAVEREPLADELPPLSAVFEAWTEMRRAANAEGAETDSERVLDQIADANPGTGQGGDADSTLSSGAFSVAKPVVTASAIAVDLGETAGAVSPKAQVSTLAAGSAVMGVATESRRASLRRPELGFAPTILEENKRASSGRPSGPISVFTEQEYSVDPPSGSSRRIALVVSGSVALVAAAFGFLGAVPTDPAPGKSVSSAPASAQVVMRPSRIPPATDKAETFGPDPVRLAASGPSPKGEAVPIYRQDSASRATGSKPAKRAKSGSSSWEEVAGRPAPKNVPEDRDGRDQVPAPSNPRAFKPAFARNAPAGATRPRIVAVPGN